MHFFPSQDNWLDSLVNVQFNTVIEYQQRLDLVQTGKTTNMLFGPKTKWCPGAWRQEKSKFFTRAVSAGSAATRMLRVTTEACPLYTVPNAHTHTTNLTSNPHGGSESQLAMFLLTQRSILLFVPKTTI